MSVSTPKTRFPRLMLIGSGLFFLVSLGLAWPKPTAKPAGSGGSSIQTQRAQAIAEAKARGERTYSYRSNFNPNNPGSR